MASARETAQTWLREGCATCVRYDGHPERYLWNWTVLVAVGEDIDHCQSRGVWKGGLAIATKRELPVGSKVRIQRRNGLAEEPWLDVQIEASHPNADGSFVVEASIDV